MFKALLRVQFASLWASLTRNTTGKKKKSAGKAVLVAILFVYILGCFVVMFGGMFYALAEPLSMLGLGWFYFALAGIVAAALCFIGSVFMAQQQLFNARDNELLLAMPIPASRILGSRMAALLLVNYAFELLVFIPAGVVWCMKLPVTAMGVVCFVLVCLLLPFLILSFTCLFAWVLALISARMRYKTLITLVLSLAFLGAYMYAAMNLQNYLAALLQSSAQLAGSVEAYAYPAYALGKAVAGGDLLSLLGFAACCISAFCRSLHAAFKVFLQRDDEARLRAHQVPPHAAQGRGRAARPARQGAEALRLKQHDNPQLRPGQHLPRHHGRRGAHLPRRPAAGLGTDARRGYAGRYGRAGPVLYGRHGLYLRSRRFARRARACGYPRPSRCRCGRYSWQRCC